MASSSHFKPSDFEGITLGKKLGAGTFGTVFVGLLRDGRYVAVKQLQLDSDEDPKAIKDNVLTGNTEISVHSRLHHPNIIRYLHASVDTTPSPPLLNVYLEFVTGGSLTAIMKTLPHGCLPLPVIKVYGKHLFQGLSYLHNNGVAHRDIKGDNLLVSQDAGIAKLADFDQAKTMIGTLTMNRKAGGAGQKATTLAGTPFWIAPEVITQEDGYDPFKADVWSAACTLGEMVTGKAPWLPLSTPMAIMYKLANSTGWPDAIPQDKDVLSEPLFDLLNLCFDRDPSTRPSAEDVLKHRFFHA